MKLKFNLLFLASFILLTSFTNFINDSEKITIVIDAGHGGFDKGTQNLNSLEKDITLEIAQQIQKQNNNKNVEIILTRNSDEHVSLADRTKLINEVNPKYFISIHLNNSVNKKLNGYEVYHSPKNEEAKVLAENFINTVNSPLENRGVKSANFHILRESKSPGFLYEMAFISDQKDYDFITSKEGKQKIVTEILNFINK